VEVRGEHRFAAPRTAVWAALHDPAALQAAIPGCDALTEVAPNSYDVSLTIGVATVSGSYAGNVTIEDVEAGQTMRVVASGAGSDPLSGSISASLADDGDGTRLSYVAAVDAPGAAGRLGGPIISGAVKMMAARFFEAIEGRLAPATPEPTHEEQP
jgi:carbon monoxide dehydrogenase subunit G